MPMMLQLNEAMAQRNAFESLVSSLGIGHKEMVRMCESKCVMNHEIFLLFGSVGQDTSCSFHKLLHS